MRNFVHYSWSTGIEILLNDGEESPIYCVIEDGGEKASEEFKASLMDRMEALDAQTTLGAQGSSPSTENIYFEPEDDATFDDITSAKEKPSPVPWVRFSYLKLWILKDQ